MIETKYSRRLSVHIISARNRPFAKETTSLQDGALLLALVGLGQEGSPGSRLKDLTNALVGTGRALEVLVGTNLLANLLTLGKSQRPIQSQLVSAPNGLTCSGVTGF